MKKLITLAIVLTLSLNLIACGKSSEVKYTSMTFGDITMSVPDEFKAATENEGMYVSSGPDSSIVVSPSMGIDLLPSEWDKSLAEESLEPLYGTTYSDMKLSTFDGDLKVNGNTAVSFSFNGKSTEGKDRLVHIVRLFNADQTVQYMITITHSADDKFITSEVVDKIINSIAIAK